MFVTNTQTKIFFKCPCSSPARSLHLSAVMFLCAYCIIRCGTFPFSSINILCVFICTPACVCVSGVCVCVPIAVYCIKFELFEPAFVRFEDKGHKTKESFVILHKPLEEIYHAVLLRLNDFDYDFIERMLSYCSQTTKTHKLRFSKELVVCVFEWMNECAKRIKNQNDPTYQLIHSTYTES